MGDELVAFLHAPKTGRVLFVCYGAGHILKVAPVVEVLRAAGVQCLVMALTIGYRKALQLGLRPVGYKDFIHLMNRDEVLAIGQTLLSGNMHPDVDAYESACYLGINYLEWEHEFGPDIARQRYVEVGRRGFLPTRFFKRILNVVQPAVVVTTSSPRSEQAAIEAAVASGIPCLTMVDFIPPSDPFMHRRIHANRLTVAARFVLDDLVRSGVPMDRIVVTGSPDFDGLFAPHLEQAASGLRALLGWEGLRVIVWAGYLEPAKSDCNASLTGAGFGVAVEQHLRDWVASHPGDALVIRYHPGQYHEFPDLGPQARVYRSNPIDEPVAPLLYLADTVIVQASTVGFEAATLGRRVLTLGFAPSVQASDFPYEKFGLGAFVQDWLELDSALNSPTRNEYQSCQLPQDGLASHRVANEIMRMLEQSTQACD